MKIEYNGHLNYDERMAQIKKEMLDEYDFLSEQELKLASFYDRIVDDKVTSDIYFKRLFNIIYACQDDINKQKKVFVDLVKIYKDNNKNNYLAIIDEINNYFEGKRSFLDHNEFDILFDDAEE